MSFQPSPTSINNTVDYAGLFSFLKKGDGTDSASTPSFSAQMKGMDFSTLTKDQQSEVLGYQTAKQDKLASIFSTVGGLATTGLSIFGAAKQSKSQQAHETVMAQEQAKLLALQQQVAQAQGVSAQAAASMQGSIQSASTTRTLLFAGGAVLVVSVLAAAFVAAKRSGGSDDYDDYEDEE